MEATDDRRIHVFVDYVPICESSGNLHQIPKSQNHEKSRDSDKYEYNEALPIGRGYAPLSSHFLFLPYRIFSKRLHFDDFAIQEKAKNIRDAANHCLLT